MNESKMQTLNGGESRSWDLFDYAANLARIQFTGESAYVPRSVTYRWNDAANDVTALDPDSTRPAFSTLDESEVTNALDALKG